MCGIVGFSGGKEPLLLSRMNESLIHRGPDDEGFYSDGEMNLAMRRLSIVDLHTGRQPISNEDNTIWVVFNGEIYNYVELRKELEAKNHRFRTDHSDTEVIVHLWEEYGEDWPLRVNGMFAVALWDSRKKKLVLYRDRIGKKPLYYSIKNSEIIFASEIKALLKHPLISRNYDFEALYSYFGLKNISAPKTAYEDIQQLLPGHLLVWEGGKVRSRPYWQVDMGSPLANVSEDEASEHLLELLSDAVKIRMRCDVPHGAYLSGGVDSSSVVALMSRDKKNSVMTFSLGYKDEANGQFAGKQDDITYARKLSQRMGTEHFEHIMSAAQFIDHIDVAISAFDEPFSGTISTFFLSELIKKHVKVALSGDGADELFGSYLAHRLAFPVENYMGLVARGQKVWGDLTEQDKMLLHPFDSLEQFNFLKSVASSDLGEWRGKLSVFSHAERGELLGQEFLEASGYPRDVYQEMIPTLTAKDSLNRSLELDQKELLPNQVLPFVDRLSMAHSVEVRSPYLDYRIIEFANSLPGTLKIKKGINKYIHKKAMKKLLPADILQRPKEGFVQPVYSWMHGPLKKWTGNQLDQLPRDIFNETSIQKLKEKFLLGDTRVNAKIWNLVCFGIWHRNSENGSQMAG